MAVPKVVQSQTDFSAGQVDVSAQRSDSTEAIRSHVRAGGRTVVNWRPLNARSLSNRPGRRMLAIIGGFRVDEFTMGTESFKLMFLNAELKVLNESNAVVATFTGLPWTADNVAQIVWAKYQNTIWIT